MVSLAKWKLSAGAVCGAVAALLIGHAALGEDAAKEVASVRQERGASEAESILYPVWLLAFAPDGKLLMCGNNDGVVFSYEVPSLKLKRKLPFGSTLSSFALSTDGKTIVAAEKMAVVVRDTEGENEPKTIQPGDAKNYGVWFVSLAADNKTIAMGVRTDIIVWDIVGTSKSRSSTERGRAPGASRSLPTGRRSSARP
jgi:hypothetical protein